MRRLLLILVLLCITTCLTAQALSYTNPVNATACTETASFTVLPASAGATYQWQINKGLGWINISDGADVYLAYSGANSGTLNLSNIRAYAHGFQFRCVITCASCTPASTATTTAATLSLRVPVTFLQLTDRICKNQALVFKADAGKGNYTWVFNDRTESGNVSGAGGFNGSLNNATVNAALYTLPGAVHLTVTSSDFPGCYVKLDSSIKLQPAYAATISNPGPFCVGGVITLNVTSSEMLDEIKWTAPSGVTTTPVSPATYTNAFSGSLTVNPATTSSAGTYQVLLSKDGCTRDSSFSVVVNTLPPAPTITSNGATSFCTGGSVLLTATGGTAYQWLKNGGFIIGATNSTYTATTAGVYTVLSYNNNCAASAVNNITVTVTDKPVLTASNDGPICEGGTATLSVTSNVGGVSYAWTGPSFTSSLQNPTIPNITVSGTYSVTATLNGCTSNAASTSVTVNQKPTAAISYAGNPFCATGTASVTQTGQTGGTYTSTAGLAINGSTGAINLSGSTPGTYTVTYTFSNGTCSNTATTTVTVNTQPTAAISYSGSPYCAVGTATVTLTGQGGGSFSSTAGLAINPATGAIDLVASTPGSYTVTYNYTNGTCPGSTTTTVTINALPTAVILYTNSPYCATGTGSVSLTGPSGGTFSGSAGLVINASTGAINLNTTPAGTYTVTYNFTSGGCSNTTSTAVTINALPTAAINYGGGNPGIFCATGTVTVNQSGPTGGTYSSTPGLSLDPNTGAINLAASTAGTYTVAYNFTNGVCPNTATATVTVNALPVAAISYPGSPYCATGSASVTQTGQTGGTYSSTAGLTINPSTGAINLSASSPGTYTVTYTFSNANCTTTTTTSVTVNPLPVISGSLLACVGVTGQLSATTTANATSPWVSSNPGVVTVNSTGLLTGISQGTSNITYTNINGCQQTVAVTTNNLPVANISYNTTGLCAAGSASVTQTGQTGGTYSAPAGLVINSSTGAVNLAASTPGTYTITYSFNNPATTCSSTTTTSLQIFPVPVIDNPPATTDQFLCQGSAAASISVATGAPGTETFQWFSNAVSSTTGGTAIPGATSPTYMPSTAVPGVLYYYVVIGNTSNCTVTSTLSGSVTVYAAPNFTVNPNTTPQVVCNNTLPSSLTVAANANAGTLNGYQWYSNATNSNTGGTLINGQTGATYAPPVGPDGTIYYYAVATNSFSCSTPSAVAAVTIFSAPTITTQPSTTPQVRCRNVAATALSVVANAGSGAISYQWYINTTNSNSGGTPIAGATGPSYTPSTTTVGTYYYYVIVSNSNGCFITSGVSGSLTVNAIPAIDIQPSTTNQILCNNALPTPLSVAASTASGTITGYQWFSNTTNMNTGGTIVPGAIGTTYTPSVASDGTLFYYAVATNSFGCQSTSAVSGAVTIYSAPVISVQPSITPQVLCKNTASVTLSITASAGSGGITGYQWFSNTINSNSGGTPIPGATSSSFTPPTSTAGVLYYYVVVANSNSCSLVSAVSGSVTVNDIPVITLQPSTTGQVVCNNQVPSAMSLSASTATGTITNYQWFSNTVNSNNGGTPIAGATSLSYTPSVASDGTLYYYATVTNSFNCTVPTATSGAITVYSAPTISVQPSVTPQVLCKNITANTLTVTTNAGSGNILGYQWFSNTINSNSGGTPITGATGPSYTPSTTNAGVLYYYVVVFNTNGCSVVSAVSGSVTVNDVPAITLQPATTGQVVCNNQTPSAVSVAATTATGTITSYQWYSNTTNSNVGGAAIAGATGTSYVPSVASDGTLYYYAIATNSFNCTTASATSGAITVYSAPTISVQPSIASQVVCRNLTAATLSVTASAGSGTIAGYQWFSNTTNSNSGGTPIGGATNATYTPSTATSGVLYYYVVITNSNGCTVISNVSGSVTVNDIPVINIVPSTTGQEVCDNQTPTAITVGATTASGTISGYQWYSNTTNSNVGGAAIAGATGTSYVPSVASDGTLYYYAIATNSFNCTTASATSGAITVYSAPTISVQPSIASQVVCRNLTAATLSVTASAGSGTIAGYQWFSNTTNSNSGGTPIGGATSATYTPSTANAGVLYYYVVITNSNGCTVISNVSGSVTVNDIPVINIVPSTTGQEVCDNQTPTAITVGATTASGTISGYQWYSNTTNSNVGGAAIAGATGTSYVPSVASDGTLYYYAIATNSFNCTTASATSGAITVYSAPTISVQPSIASQVVCRNLTAATLSVTASAGSGTIAGYQWFSNTTNSNSGGTPIGGATSATYTPSTANAGVLYYYVVITNSNGCTVISNVSGSVTVNDIPVINIVPSTTGQVVCDNQTPTPITVGATTATGTITNYQWYTNTTNSNIGGTPIAGASGINYTSHSPSLASDGTLYYYAIATNSFSCTTASATSGAITVYSAPVITVQPSSANQDVCVNNPALSVEANAGSGTISYQWFSNTSATNSGGTLIPGATTNVYTPSSAEVGTKYFYCVISNSNGCSVTTAASGQIKVKPIPVAAITGTSVTCEATTIGLNAADAGVGSVYTWTTPAAGNVNGISLTIPNALPTYSGVYSLTVVKDGCINSASKGVFVTPLPLTVINGQTDICEASVLQLTASDAGTGSAYTWLTPAGVSVSNKVLKLLNMPLTGGGDYQLTVFKDGCQKSVTTKVAVRPLPEASVAGVNALCEREDLILTGSSNTPGTSLAWNGPANYTASGAVVNITSIPTTYSGTFVLSATNNGCTRYVQKAVLVKPLPITAIQGKSAWCEGNNITLEAADAGTTALYKWTLQQQTLSTNKQLVISNAGLNASGEYKLTVTLEGCSDETNKKLAVNQTPVVSLNPAAPVCQYYAPYAITANETTGLPGSGVFSGQVISSSGIIDPVKSGDYPITYTYTASNGCASSAVQTIKILPGVLVNAGIDKVQLANEGTQLSSVTTGKYNSLLWTNITGPDATKPAPLVNPIATTTYSITIKNDVGCVATDDVTVKVVYMKIPNAFSPNADGIHDKWIIEALADFPDCAVEIFNRWGQKVFNSRGYTEPWDGTMKGQPAPSATYYYIIHLNDKPGRRPFAGWLQLLR